MVGTSIRLDHDDAAVLAGLDRLLALGEDTTPLMEDIAGHLEMTVLRRFEEERGPGDTPWPPSIRARVDGGQTLTHSGRLRGSITSRAGRDHAEVGTNVVYAATHQHGATIRPRSARALAFAVPGVGFMQVGKVEIPARSFLGFDAADEAAIGEIAADALSEAWE